MPNSSQNAKINNKTNLDINRNPDGSYGTAKGENKLYKGYIKSNLDRHFGSGSCHDHSGEYPNMTQKQYARRAVTLAQSEVGKNIIGYKNEKGHICRYDTNTNDYVKADPKSGQIITMFKPNDGIEYFKRRMAKENGHTND